MQNLNFKNYRVLAGALLFWLVLDLGSKQFASRTLHTPMVFIDHLFYFTLHQNKGIAFGFMFGQWAQIAVSIVVLAALIYFSHTRLTASQKKGFINQLLLGIIIGGALGNLINRFYPGFVVDFIYLYPFPVFNIADIGITLGLIAFVLSLSSSSPHKILKQ